MTRGGEILGTLRPVRGSLRVALARWLLWIATPLASVQFTRRTIEGSVAREPYFTASSQAPDLLQLIELARRLRPALVVLAAGAAITWLLLQLLTAGALIRLQRGRSERTTLWRAVWDGGSRALLPYLRVAVVAAALSAAGAWALALGFGWLADHGEIAGWSGRTLVRDLPLARALLTAVWVTAVGVFAFWLRVLLARERRLRVRVAAWRALRLWLRRPFATLGFHWTVAVATLLAQGALLLAWQGAAASRWRPLWLALLLLSAYAWQWRLRSALRVLESTGRAGGL